MPLWVGRRAFAWIARQSLGAKVPILGCAPERTRSGLRNRVRRMAGADSGVRPPRHGHIAAVERMESALGMAPINAVCAVRADRQRFGGDALAAPLPAPRLRPVGGFFRVYRRLRRMPSAETFVLPEPAPKRAGGAIGGSALITHCALPLAGGLIARDTAQNQAASPALRAAAAPTSRRRARA